MTILHSFFISLYIRTAYKTGSWNLLSTHPFLSVFNVLWTPLVVWKKTAHKNPSKTATVTNKTDHTFSIFSSPTQAHKFFLVTRVSALATNWQSVQKKKKWMPEKDLFLSELWELPVPLNYKLCSVLCMTAFRGAGSKTLIFISGRGYFQLPFPTAISHVSKRLSQLASNGGQ